jgi:flagellar biosynthesis/type III secretory pathway protein FliH
MSETGHAILTQEGFTETPYHDAEWEVIGAPPTEQTFAPAQIEVLAEQRPTKDPLFSDYGGFSSLKGKKQRWHLPEDLAVQQKDSGESPEERIAKMVEDNAARYEALEKRAFESGHKAGFAESQGKIQEHVNVVSERMTTLLSDLNKQVLEQSASVEQQAVQLAVEIARQLTRATVDYNPEYILPIVREGLEQVGGAVVKQIKVSKEDLEFLTLAGALAGLEGAGSKWHFVADDSVKSGCIVETASGEIDLQIEPAFERVKNQILKAIK